MCNSNHGTLQYSSETLRKIGVNWSIPPKRVVRKTLFSTRIWSRHCDKLDYVFDHIFDNDLDIVALTETWLSTEDNNNRHVITECSNHGYTLHHVPRTSGSTGGGGVGVLINDRVKLVTRLETVNSAVSFESMEMIVTIVSIFIRLVVIYRMPL